MNLRHRICAAALVGIACPAVHAGIPVIDIANLIQAIQQVSDDVTQIRNQISQLNQMRDQFNSMTGARGLGAVNNNPLLRNYVPPNAYNALNAVNSGGYAGLSPTAKALRDADMVYNCMDLSGADRIACQSRLAQPYQHKGLLQDAMTSAASRLAQIDALMGQINATTDTKAVQEIQARIGAENALLSHEMSQIEMLRGMAD
jgi:type IV secretion system protein VirB5